MLNSISELSKVCEKEEKKENVRHKNQEPMAKEKKLKEKEQVQCFHHFTYMLINYSNLIPHSHIS